MIVIPEKRGRWIPLSSTDETFIEKARKNKATSLEAAVSLRRGIYVADFEAVKPELRLTLMQRLGLRSKERMPALRIVARRRLPLGLAEADHPGMWVLSKIVQEPLQKFQQAIVTPA